MQKSKAEASSANPGVLRIIKKYPNRRLYDTDTSSYITLAEVKALVMDNEHFVVRDAKTNDDLTRSILLQIILEEEAGGAPMFTSDLLAQMIRFYGHSMQDFMGSYLDKNLQIFMEMQQKMTDQAKGLTTAAGIWLTAAIGVAVGLGHEATAVMSTLLALAIFALMPRLERHTALRAARKRRRPDQPR